MNRSKLAKLTRLERSYSPKEEIPLKGYALTTAIFGAVLAGLLSRSRKGKVPELSLSELALAGTAIHKVSRIITKDAVTSFVRAPFTRYVEPLGYGELNEVPRRTDALEALAELINCNYCMSVWTSAAFFWGYALLPNETRFLSRFFTSVALSDFLHVVYEDRRTHSNVLSLQESELESKQRDRSQESAQKAG